MSQISEFQLVGNFLLVVLEWVGLSLQAREDRLNEMI